MRWWWYATPVGWLQAYLSASVFVHEFGHLLAARLTGQQIVRFKVGCADPVFSFTFRDIRFEFSGDAMGGALDVDKNKDVPQLSILLTALAGPLANLISAGVILGVIRMIAPSGPGVGVRAWLAQALLVIVFFEAWHAVEAVPREIRNILRKS